MSPGRLLVALLFVAVAAGLLVWNTRKGNPERHVQEVSYPIRCLNCKATGSLTIAEMNRMVAAGDVESPPEQMRRFKCASCSERAVVLDAGGRGHASVVSIK